MKIASAPQKGGELAKDDHPFFSTLEGQAHLQRFTDLLNDEERGLEFLKLIGLAQEGGSTFSECLLVASRIDRRDSRSWCREWKRIADTTCERAQAAFSARRLATARSNWLRALCYYRLASIGLESAGNGSRSLQQAVAKCARLYVEHAGPAGEVVEIPWLSKYPLQGLFLPQRNSSLSPVVICMADPGQPKEDLLCKAHRYARDRGMSLLAVDLLGDDGGARFHEIVGRSDLETAVGSVVDYLVARDDVDENRIAIVNDAGSSSFVARGVALDRRLAAAVCDGGIWDCVENEFLIKRDPSRNAQFAAMIKTRGIARTLNCPVLVTMGEQGWLKPDRVIGICDQLRSAGGDISLKLFHRSETASLQGHSDNPTLANEYIFDWLAERLGTGS
jgi:hypothetical protein